MPYRKGQGGRPRGARNQATKELKDFWREFFESDAWRENAKYRMVQGKAPHLESYWLNKTFGRPTEHVELTGQDGGPVTVVHEHSDN